VSKKIKREKDLKIFDFFRDTKTIREKCHERGFE
jgi:hypothetical protein